MSDPRTALVTGASRGIGEAISIALGSKGVRVALIARSTDALERIAAKAGSESFAVQCDVTDSAAVESAISIVTGKFDGPPDVIVNNAGLFTIKAFDETSSTEFETMLDTNLRAPFQLVRGFLPAMRARGRGHIVTIGSVADRHIYAGNAAYSATKYGQRAMHEVLREETRGSGVRSTLISPAAVDTDIWEPIHYLGTSARPDRSGMLDASAVSDAVLFAIDQPQGVNVDELRLSRA